MQNIYSYISSKFTFQTQSRPRLHIREICEICERINIYSKFTFYLLSKPNHIIYFHRKEIEKEICDICERIKHT